MRVEMIDRISLNVKDRDEAVRFWTENFGLVFPEGSLDREVMLKRGSITHTYTEHAGPDERARAIPAVSTIGLEVMQRDPPLGSEGIRGIVLKVLNLPAAKMEMRAKGIRSVHEIKWGELGVIYYHQADLGGVRVTLSDYSRREQIQAGNFGQANAHPVGAEKIDRVSLDVLDLEGAKRFWSGIFGLSFTRYSAGTKARHWGAVTPTYTEWADSEDRTRPMVAVATLGLELIQRNPPIGVQGLRGIRLKVPSLERSRAFLTSRGFRLVHTVTVGAGVFKEDLYHLDDCHNVRLKLCEYTDPELALVIFQ